MPAAILTIHEPVYLAQGAGINLDRAAAAGRSLGMADTKV